LGSYPLNRRQIVIGVVIVVHLISTGIIRHGIGVRHLGVAYPEGPSGKKLSQMIDIVIKSLSLFSCGGRQRTVVLYRPADSLPPEFPASVTGDKTGIGSGIDKSPKLFHGIRRVLVSA